MRVEYITVGAVVGTHGIRGEVKVNPLGVDPALIAGCDALYFSGKRMDIAAARVHKNTVLLSLPGVEDMDAALALKGKTVTIRRDEIQLPEGVFFDEELTGLTAVDEATGEELGAVTRVLHYPAHDVYEIKGRREYLVPAVPEVFVASVDLDGGVICLRMQKGLATDEN